MLGAYAGRRFFFSWAESTKSNLTGDDCCHQTVGHQPNPLLLLLNKCGAERLVCLSLNAGETDDGSRKGKGPARQVLDRYHSVKAGALSISRSSMKKHNVQKDSQQCDEAESVKFSHGFPPKRS